MTYRANKNAGFQNYFEKSATVDETGISLNFLIRNIDKL
jgi:hypothetical protein